jgi:hypothetical protein
MYARDLVPDGITFQVVMQALDSAHRFEELLAVFNDAMRLESTRNIFGHVLTADAKVDLNSCSIAVAHGALLLVLHELVSGARPVADVIIVTSQGWHSKRWDPISLHDVRAFLARIGGPRVTELDGKPNCIALASEDIQTWLSDGLRATSARRQTRRF